MLEVERNTRNRAGRVVPTWAARGIATDRRWRTVEYPESGETELYDLTGDPGELYNLDHSPRSRDQRDRRAARLEGHQDCAGPTGSGVVAAGLDGRRPRRLHSTLLGARRPRGPSPPAGPATGPVSVGPPLPRRTP